MLQLSSCDKDVVYVKQEDGQNHLIDFKSFSIIVPVDFKFKKQKGIDSYIGKIENDNTTFHFDYGLYSPRPPITKEQFYENNKKELDQKSTQLFLKLIDLQPYRDKDNRINPLEITKKIKNLSLKVMHDSIVLSKGQNTICEYYYSFEFENTEFKIPLPISKKESDDFEYYEIKTDTINNYQRTIAIWKNKNVENYSSVNLVPLHNDPYKKELWVGINTDKKMSTKQIREILETVTLKDN
ncbi:hypothetical protein [Aquimarina sediminis]|uniref:hypothetical protein n=1 Tax=Aquimarina sediminis TaxID=2070536 RepID=UPI000CA073D8|nr:hypothetical protein [Aquimarina sediminis]